MMNFIRLKLKFLMWFVSGAFVVGLFIGGGTLGRTWLVNFMPAWFLITLPGCARSAGIMMKVGNYNVKVDEFRRIKENSVEVARIQYKDNFDTYAKNMDFDKVALEGITRYALLIREADRHHIHISKGELEQGIKDFPSQMPDEAIARVKLIPYYYYSMSKSGEFNYNAFIYLLTNQGKITLKDFTKEVENGLRIARLKETMSESAFVTDLEVQQEYKKQNVKAKIKYLELQYKDFTSKVEVSDAELNNFFQENLLDYKANDKVNISFIRIDPRDFESKIEISDAEVVSYYKAHKDKDYPQKTMEEVKDEIISKLKEEEALVQARQKAEDIQYTIMSEENLQAAVDANPNMNLKVEETGLFAKDEFIPKIGPAYAYRDIAEEAFKLKVGEISSLVEVKSYGDRVLGFFIFKLLGKKPGGIPKLEDVKSDVAMDLKNEKARKPAMEEAKRMMADSNPASDLNKIAAKYNLKVNESEPFTISSGGYIRSQASSQPGSQTGAQGGYIDSKAVMLSAFTMKIGEVAGPYEGGNGVYIIQLVERGEFDDKELAANKDEVKKLYDQLLKQRQQDIYNTWYQKVRAKASVRSFMPEITS